MMSFKIECCSFIFLVICLLGIHAAFNNSEEQVETDTCSYIGVCTSYRTIFGINIPIPYACEKSEPCETTWGRWGPCYLTFRSRFGRCVGTNCRKRITDRERCYRIKTVCYILAGSGGTRTCFSNAPPFDNALGLLPERPFIVGTKYYLHTRTGANVSEEIYTDSLSESTLLEKRDTKIIIHGWLENSDDTHWISPMVTALLDLGDFNVIVVDWRRGADRVDYEISVANTRLVGAQIGFLVKALEDSYNISRADVHLIGLSLGGQITGYAGQSLPGIGRISGLDPAGPSYYGNSPEIHLTKDDALYVDITHSNSGQSLLQGLGLSTPLGTADFYPNGGRLQPGCEYPANASALDIINIFEDYDCSHLRSADLYIESIKGTCPFNGYPCVEGQLENNTAPEVCNDCGAEGCARMGYYAQEDGAEGIYYLNTTGTAPFCDDK